MILHRLTLVNLGVYRGRHELDLRPQDGRPIVLLGGKNGAGKTTLMEAIRLCLHGAMALDESQPARRNRHDYEQYLRGRIHRSANGVIPLDWASVELEFEYAIAGERHTYTVERSWKDDGKRVKETLRVRQGPEPTDEMDARQWDGFIRGLIPPALTQLVFFDGEKILALANGARDVQQAALARAIRSLLGLNVVEQLHADLSVYRRRQQKGQHVDTAQQRIEVLEGELAQVEAERDDLLAQSESLKAQIETVEAKIILQEAEIARVGGDFARQREVHKAAQVRLKTEIEGTEQAIRDLCAGLLPFAITPPYTTAVKTQLLREAAYQQWLTAKTFIEQKRDEIQAELTSSAFWQGSGAEALVPLQRTMGERFVQTLQRLTEPPEDVRDVTPRHHVSDPERAQLLSWIEESQTIAPDQLEGLTTRLVQLKGELEEAEQALQRVPPDDVLGPLMETLNGHHRELGGLAQARQRIEETLRQLELRREALERSLRAAREDKAARQKLAERINRAVDVQLVLDDFAARLVQLRVSQLEEALARNFNRLCRKERLLRRVDIDPRDFSVALVGAGGETFPQSALSAGERQIYAIALLWALRQVSGRPLPALIDAPLGRMDSDHRQNLVERYFPHASHQVILSSTDTEVDAEFYAALQGCISRAYHLEYDQAQSATRVRPGYFWRSDGGETG